MIKESPGQLNFTHFLTLFGEKMHGKQKAQRHKEIQIHFKFHITRSFVLPVIVMLTFQCRTSMTKALCTALFLFATT